MNQRRLLVIISLFVLCFFVLNAVLLSASQTPSVWTAGNMISAIDKILGGWLIVPPALSWAITGCLFGAVAYFTVFEAHRIGQTRNRLLFIAAAYSSSSRFTPSSRRSIEYTIWSISA